MSGAVPRGTRVLALRFSEAMYQAIERDLKVQTRRPMTAGNCQISRGKFGLVDFSSGRAGMVTWPMAPLRVRVETESGDRRSALVLPRVRPGMHLWCRRGQAGHDAKRENAKFFLRVLEVRPSRLNDISEEDAIAEGVLAFCPPEISRVATTGDQLLQASYNFQLAQMGKTNAARWRAGSIDQDVCARGRATARDCFALLWESINGPQTWADNPWVWKYAFRRVKPAEVLE